MIPGYLYALDDPNDPTFGIDKLTHFGWAAALWFALERHVGAPLPWFAAAAIAVELVEVWRYRRWVARLAPQPWPFLTDKISLKDLVVDALGAAVAWLL